MVHIKIVLPDILLQETVKKQQSGRLSQHEDQWLEELYPRHPDKKGLFLQVLVSHRGWVWPGSGLPWLLEGKQGGTCR